jgi:hypothetical protein
MALQRSPGDGHSRFTLDDGEAVSEQVQLLLLLHPEQA